jgi:hypothetical protein
MLLSKKQRFNLFFFLMKALPLETELGRAALQKNKIINK